MRFVLFLMLVHLSLFLVCQEKKPKNGTWVTLPAAVFSPENGLGLGVGSLRVFKLNRDDSTARSSQLQAIALYTTENQFLLSPRYLLFTRGERYFLSGRVQIFKFPEFYYGIGNETPKSNEELVEYNYIGYENRVLRQMIPGFFSGLEFRYYHRFNFDLVEGGLLERTRVPGYNGSKVAGLGPLFLWDRRDNIANAFEGHYVLLAAYFYGKFLGGRFNFTNYQVDVRKYFRLLKDKEQVLAFQFLGNFIQGVAPFRQLSALGGSRMMRGYYLGRFRDQHLLATQVEYRTPVWWRIGAVGFAGVGNVFNEVADVALRNLRYSVGGGLRFSVDREERVNIRFDLGIGKGTTGFYFNVAEAF